MPWLMKPGAWWKSVTSQPSKTLNIVLLEPFLAGSHQSWAEQFAEYSRHEVTVLGLDGRYWKWRMHGGAVTLAQQFLASSLQPDVIIATDMIDLTTFQALTRQCTAQIPTVLYFHENQLTYPWSPQDADVSLKRDSHYAFINYISALSANRVLFNSSYHRQAFLTELPAFLNVFPDCSLGSTCSDIETKSGVLPIGLNLTDLDRSKPTMLSDTERPLVLWNHRWEYDKNPQDFFQVLYQLKDDGVVFDLAVLGESYRSSPAIFAEAKERLADHILHWGFAENRQEYIHWLWRADYLPVTSVHDFFGISVVEAIYCDCYPLLPKRMAYPEHLPADALSTYCYGDTNDLYLRLADLLRQGGLPPLDMLRTKVANYDWNTQILAYDDLLFDVYKEHQES